MLKRIVISKQLFSILFLLIIILVLGCSSTNQASTGAVFSLSDLIIEPRAPATGAAFSISVTVTNDGDSQDEYSANLCIDELQIEDANSITIISTKTFNKSEIIKEGESAVITFDSLVLQAGLYTATIGDLVDYIEVGC